MKLTIKALLALLALSVVGQDGAPLSRTEQVTCLSSDQPRCRVSIGTIYRSNRIFALKVGERMVFDLMAREKRRCWGSACSAATVYRWPEYEDGQQAWPFAYGSYNQALHHVHTRQEVYADDYEIAQYGGGITAWSAAPSTAHFAPSRTERYTCLGRHTCTVHYGIEGSTSAPAAEIAVGETLVHDLDSQTLRSCLGDGCTPFGYGWMVPPVGSVHPQLSINRGSPHVLVKTRRTVRVIEAVEGGHIVQGAPAE